MGEVRMGEADVGGRRRQPGWQAATAGRGRPHRPLLLAEPILGLGKGRYAAGREGQAGSKTGSWVSERDLGRTGSDTGLRRTDLALASPLPGGFELDGLQHLHIPRLIGRHLVLQSTLRSPRLHKVDELELKVRRRERRRQIQGGRVFQLDKITTKQDQLQPPRSDRGSM